MNQLRADSEENHEASSEVQAASATGADLMRGLCRELEVISLTMCSRSPTDRRRMT